MDQDTIERLLATLPTSHDFDPDGVAEAVDACGACAQACASYAFVLQAGHRAGLGPCIDASLYCAEVCETTVGVLCDPQAAAPLLVPALLRVCVQAVRTWHEDCAVAPRPGHARNAQAARRCERACARLLGAAGGERG